MGWKRWVKKATGVTKAKRKFAKVTGIPTSRSGRRAKVSRLAGCSVVVLAAAGILGLAAVAVAADDPLVPTEKEFAALTNAKHEDHKATAEKYDGKRLKLVGLASQSYPREGGASNTIRLSEKRAGLLFETGDDTAAADLRKKLFESPKGFKITLYGIYDAKSNRVMKATTAK